MDDSVDLDYSDWSEDEDVAPTKKAQISPIQPPSPPGPLPDSLPDTMALGVKSTSPAPELSLDNPAPKEDLVPVTEEVPVLSASKQDSSTRALPQSAVSEPPEREDTSVTRTVEESVHSAPQRDDMQLTKAVPVAMASTDDRASTTSTKRKPTGSKMRCPARGCKKRGTEEELAWHWQNAHESQVVLWLCPMQRCNQWFRSAIQLSIHLRKRHKVSRPVGRRLDNLPPLADLAHNNTFQFPGVARPSYAVEPTLPQGALGHLMKATVQSEVEAILNAKDSTSGTNPPIAQESPLTDEKQWPWFPPVPPPLPPAPPQLPPAPETRERLPPILDVPLSPQRPAFPPGPSAPPPQLTPLPLCTQVQQPDQALSSSSIQPWHWMLQAPPPPPALPPTTIREEVRSIPLPATISATVPATVRAPAATITSSSSLEEMVVQDRRVVWKDTCPPEPPPQRKTSAVATACPTPTVSENGEDPLTSHALRVQVRSLDTTVDELLRQRREASEGAFSLMKREYDRKARECQTLKQRVAYLESELRGYQQDKKYICRPTLVGHLQSIGSTRAHLLMPNRGHTTVCPLTAQDIDLLDLDHRDQAISCDPL